MIFQYHILDKDVTFATVKKLYVVNYKMLSTSEKF